MANVLFIVWRESLEAVLVIGILYAFLAKMQVGRRGYAWLATGVGGGLALSALLGFATLTVASDLQGRALGYFQSGMMLAAAALLTQMVLWMRKHGRTLKRELETDMAKAMSTGSLAGVAIVALLAVAREGAETVLYLYGLGFEHHNGGPLALAGAAALGLALALVTAWLVSRGVRFLSYRVFFRVTGVLLLFTAAGMLVSGVSRLIGMGALPGLMAPVWDTSMILDSNSRIGALVSALTGYRAEPSLMLVLVYGIYWALIIYWMRLRRPSRPQPQLELNPRPES
ncbi:MAG: FTR1 family protein [Gammaproteobacteria bacterium]|jgi:high-affinity iron transporter